MAVTTTQRSLAYMRKKNYYAEVVERYNSFTRRKNDLFGFIDILCLKEGEVLGVQTTTSAHMAERITKIRTHENYPAVKEAGIVIVVHGWVKRGRLWEVREAVL